MLVNQFTHPYFVVQLLIVTSDWAGFYTTGVGFTGSRTRRKVLHGAESLENTSNLQRPLGTESLETFPLTPSQIILKMVYKFCQKSWVRPSTSYSTHFPLINLIKIPGSNPWFINGQLSVVDTAVFATLAQALWGMPTSTVEGLVRGQFAYNSGVLAPYNLTCVEIFVSNKGV